MSGEPQPAGGSALVPEEMARANLYALVGRLFYDAPDSILLAEICREEGEPAGEVGAVGVAWSALRGAARSAYPAVLKQEYDTLFVGVGRAQVTPYTSHYIPGNSPDRQLVRLRELLAQWGLARRSAAFEVEDHVSGICDVMRFLVLESRPDEEQRLFFNEFAYAGCIPFFDSVTGSVSAVFYRHVADFARAFFELEKTAFEMQDL
ncbi:MAG: hypothetical protein A3I02_06890 [Betaproteobacteria bacterium RIFCSPLOWO2_02_FULL_67_26]|nr:MAG: hypothetical protein A3I02_06890 [Betaproteobacteria bacterium RIFCSPLOWO2_02_FULL_67_26]